MERAFVLVSSGGLLNVIINISLVRFGLVAGYAERSLARNV